MSTGNILKMFLGSKARLLRGADNLTAIYEQIVYTLWDPLPKDLEWLEGLEKLKKFIHLIRFRTRNFPACSTVPEPLCYPLLPYT
jgi:hypothetical protein